MPPRRLEQLVESQVKRWEVEHRASVPAPRAPCIALSRHPGANAESLGHQVAEWLDYGFFGTEIVDRIAQERDVQRELVVGLDEHVRGVIERYVTDFLRRDAFRESDYLEAVARTIATLGERGMAVILGRGAPFLLPKDRALRVLVTAPPEARSQRLAERMGIDLEEADKHREYADAERRKFLQSGFQVDPDEPSRYDLVVNTATLSTAAAGRIVIEALRRRFPAT